MPKLPEHLQQQKEQPKGLLLEPKVKYGEGRWKCQLCDTVHHFDSVDGCHSPKCSYKGRLERVR